MTRVAPGALLLRCVPGTLSRRYYYTIASNIIISTIVQITRKTFIKKKTIV